MSPDEPPVLWLTRGKHWGFRFLRDGDLGDPLPLYDRVFDGVGDAETIYTRADSNVALRFPDPEGRQDAAGRLIPHDFVVLPPLADQVWSLDDGRRLVWEPLAGVFRDIWDAATAPPLR